MDGIHDLGGMQGFGAVAHSPAEPSFRPPWEAVTRALMVVVVGAVEASGGEFRHSIERMEPGHYLTSSYYEHWLTAAATLAVEHGLVTRAELEAPRRRAVPAQRAGAARRPSLTPVPDVDTAPLWRRRPGAGARVASARPHPLPGLCPGQDRAVVRVDGIYSVPDIEAHGAARRREPTYSVRFDAAELWRDGQRGVWVHVDLWDSYLERIMPRRAITRLRCRRLSSGSRRWRRC